MIKIEIDFIKIFEIIKIRKSIKIIKNSYYPLNAHMRSIIEHR